MVDLTRLNGSRLLLNCDLIKYAEATPDTTLTLVTGEKLIVGGTCEDLLERIRVYRSEVLAGAWPDAASALSGQTASNIAAKDK